MFENKFTNLISKLILKKIQQKSHEIGIKFNIEKTAVNKKSWVCRIICFYYFRIKIIPNQSQNQIIIIKQYHLKKEMINSLLNIKF